MSLTDYTVSDKRIWNAGREYEQERIIKLLKSYEVEVVVPVDFAIALIKGEK